MNPLIIQTDAFSQPLDPFFFQFPTWGAISAQTAQRIFRKSQPMAASAVFKTDTQSIALRIRCLSPPTWQRAVNPSTQRDACMHSWGIEPSTEQKMFFQPPCSRFATHPLEIAQAFALETPTTPGIGSHACWKFLIAHLAEHLIST